MIIKNGGKKDEEKLGSGGMRKLGEREPKAGKGERLYRQIPRKKGATSIFLPSPRACLKQIQILCGTVGGASGQLTGWC